MVLILLVGAIPVIAATNREVWVPSPAITCGINEDEVSVNKAIHMGVARLYKLDKIGDKYYLAVLERKFSDGGTNANRDHSELYYYSLLETDDSFIVLGRDFLFNEYSQDALEDVIDISNDIDIEYYEKQGCEAPIYIVNPNDKYTCADWEEDDEFVFIGSNGGMAGISDTNTYAQARYPIVRDGKFYTGKYRYESDDRGNYYYLDDGKTKATVLDLCGIKNGNLEVLSSTKVATTDITAENGYTEYKDEGFTGNVRMEEKYLISEEKNLYLSYWTFKNETTGMYECTVQVNQIINGNSINVNEYTFSSGKTSSVTYTLSLIQGLDSEKYKSKNMEVPIAMLGKVFITEEGHIYELTPEADLSSKNICIYDGILSFVRTYVDGAYIRYTDENGTNQYWQRINTLNFTKGKVTASEDMDILVGAHDNLDGYYSSYKSFVTCSTIKTAKKSSILEWWPHYLDSKFSDGRYISGHWVTNESGSYEIWYDIYDENGVKISTGPSGYSIGASAQRYCPKIRFFVMNDTKVILTTDDLEYDVMEEYYRAAVVTENDEGIVEVPIPIGKKNIVAPDGADTVPTERVVDFASDDLELGFNVKENILGTDKFTPELREQINTIRLDSIVIVAKEGYISGKQNTGVTLSGFDEYEHSFGNSPVRFYSNGQYLCWYCDEPEKLNEGTYNVSYPIGELTICAVVKVITPPSNDSYTTVVF